MFASKLAYNESHKRNISQVFWHDSLSPKHTHKSLSVLGKPLTPEHTLGRRALPGRPQRKIRGGGVSPTKTATQRQTLRREVEEGS